jgi:hypothetical protein
MKILGPISLLLLFSCISSVKGDKKEKEDPLSDTANIVQEYVPEPTQNLLIDIREDLIGYWVGWFNSAIPNREFKWGEMTYRSKINVSIDSFVNDSVFGHSVIANNYTPFRGLVTLDEFDIYHFRCEEPGDGSHDGIFRFKIGTKDSVISGKWDAFGDVDVYKRDYKLSKQLFEYKPEVELISPYFDELKVNPDNNYTLDSVISEFGSIKKAYNLMIGDGEDTATWDDSTEAKYGNIIVTELNMYDEEYYSTSPSLFEFNPSMDTLEIEVVENLSKADIYILRNSIYARHGYSFRQKDLRLYFDQQPWYFPVIADIRSELTDVEKINIKTLLAFEEHAEEYYDYYGR